MTGTPAPGNSGLLVADGVAVELDGAELLAPTTLALAAGTCVAVRGQNGAGKTTLLRVLSGRLRPTAGSVRLAGDALDERRADHRAAVAALIEPPTLYPDLTIQDQLALIEAAWSGARSGSRSEPLERAAIAGPGFGSGAIDHFGLEGLRTRFPHELSSGQRQLVSLAVTFARPASVLLLDEPEQRLDPDRRGLVAEAIERARAQGVAVAFATHDPELVARVADAEVVVGVA